MATAMTLDEIQARLREIAERLQEIDTEYAGTAFAPDVREEWETLGTERDDLQKLQEELERRRAFLVEISDAPEHREEPQRRAPQTARPGAARGGDIFDLSTIERTATDPHGCNDLKDRAKRAVETAVFPEQVKREVAQEHIERLLERHDDPERKDGLPGEVSRRILNTGSPTYRRAFKKYLAGVERTPEEQRALAVGSGAAGGFAVVFTLDPTIIPTSNFSVNPFRAFARQETIAGTNEWRGVTSAGVTASYAAEAAAATDNAPTLAQPAVIVNKAHCFVPFSIELGQDWGSLQTEMVGLIQDAKDDLEAVQFATGTGTPPAPQGLITGATTTVAAGGVASFAIADLYKLEEAVPPRFRPRSIIAGNRFVLNKVRQFDTAGGSGVWSLDQLPGNLQAGLPTVPRGGNTGAQILGYPVYESSGMAAALTTGSKILAMGDPRYFIIVDRVGLDVEVIPHLFGATQGNLPTGQRGIYAYWRNNSKVLDVNGFRILVTG